ncbi:MAG: flavodoxin [Bacillota bacterium]|jgi:flavodoxin|nr:flavodoxin [Bacillota bacterium]
MRILVVYDSIHGNTKAIAESIGNSYDFDDELVKVINVKNADINNLKNIDLLIVGSPTIYFKPTAAIENFLDSIPVDGLKGIKVMAFDTRYSKVEMMEMVLKKLIKSFEYAAEPISEKLVKKGGKLITAPEGFIAKANKGPLHEGEIERAVAWAQNTVEDNMN